MEILFDKRIIDDVEDGSKIRSLEFDVYRWKGKQRDAEGRGAAWRAARRKLESLSAELRQARYSRCSKIVEGRNN